MNASAAGQKLVIVGASGMVGGTPYATRSTTPLSNV